MRLRSASLDDAEGMSRMLREIVAQTGRERPSDPAFVAAQYIVNPTGIRCTVALDPAGEVLGFQSLIRAAAGNQYDVPEGWGINGTHISPRAHRRGVGTALFAASRAAAIAAGLESIDACIPADNASGLAYYEAMGFRTYRERDGSIQKRFGVDAGAATSTRCGTSD